jgi:lipoprotein NlpI
MDSRFVCALVVFLAASAPGAAQQPGAGDVQSIFDRAVADFLDGRISESVAGFDEVVRRAPEAAPQLWQRGIALYYAGRYQDCREQFEAHRRVNPNDVENAAWHFLCVSRLTSVNEARAALLPVGPDARVPMTEVYEMLRDRLRPDDVLSAALAQAARPDAVFFAHLYMGLYFEALGNDQRALQHIREAAADRYVRAGGYMHAVARVHLDLLRNNP